MSFIEWVWKCPLLFNFWEDLVKFISEVIWFWSLLRGFWLVIQSLFWLLWFSISSQFILIGYVSRHEPFHPGFNLLAHSSLIILFISTKWVVLFPLSFLTLFISFFLPSKSRHKFVNFIFSFLLLALGLVFLSFLWQVHPVSKGWDEGHSQ